MKQSGFTLIEMLIALAIFGVAIKLLSPSIGLLLSVNRANYAERQAANNRQIAASLLLYAKNQSGTGQLPAPYSGGGYTSTSYNPGDSSAAGLALQSYLQQQGVGLAEVNDDNYAAHRVRVYQSVTGLTRQMPLYVQSGPLVTLTYSFGAVYQTACALADATCNPSVTGVPGTSAVLTSSNFGSWNVSGSDASPAFVSTLPLQESMLDLSVSRLQSIRDKLTVYFNALRLGAAPGDTTNWYPTPNGTGAVSLAGANAVTNEACYDGWYQLNAANVNVLPIVGLGQAEYGVTAWGGRVEYCRDYDPVYAGAGVAPHYAALRINAGVTSGLAPDNSVAGNNVFITF